MTIDNPNIRLDEYDGERYPVFEVGSALLALGSSLLKQGESVVVPAPSAVVAHLVSNLGITAVKVQQHPAHEDWALVTAEDGVKVWVP